jgi:hypothetical protein
MNFESIFLFNVPTKCTYNIYDIIVTQLTPVLVHTTLHVGQGHNPHWIEDYSRCMVIHCHNLEEYCP